jgi:hypothetical protein
VTLRSWAEKHIVVDSFLSELPTSTLLLLSCFAVVDGLIRGGQEPQSKWRGASFSKIIESIVTVLLSGYGAQWGIGV